MRNAKPMKLSSTGIWKLFWIVLLCLPGWKEMHAQDPLPEQPPHDKNSGPVYSSSEMQKLMRFVEVEDPMPASFKNTQENRIDDPTGSLNAFGLYTSVIRTCEGMFSLILCARHWKPISEVRPWSISR